MLIKNIIAPIIKDPYELILTSQYRIHKVLTLDRCDYHIIYLVLAGEIIFIDDLQTATAFVTIENVLARTPQMTTLNM